MPGEGPSTTLLGRNMRKISRIHGFERFFEKYEKNLFLASKKDVKTTLDLCARHRTWHNLNRDGGWSKCKTILDIGHIPKSVYFSPVFNQMGVDKMSPEEQEEVQDAFFNVFTKFKTR